MVTSANNHAPKPLEICTEFTRFLRVLTIASPFDPPETPHAIACTSLGFHQHIKCAVAQLRSALDGYRCCVVEQPCARVGILRRRTPRGAKVHFDRCVYELRGGRDGVRSTFFQIRENLKAPTQALLARPKGFTAPRVILDLRPRYHAPRREMLIARDHSVHREPHLLQLVFALRPPGSLPG